MALSCLKIEKNVFFFTFLFGFNFANVNLCNTVSKLLMRSQPSRLSRGRSTEYGSGRFCPRRGTSGLIAALRGEPVCASW